ncbi:MAG TPA: hypothetical protein VGF55_02735 [Gemmataceae bacterium]|jgi:hypothetical protein
MPTTIQTALAPVRRRQRLAFAARAAAYGLLAGGLAAAALTLVRWRTTGTASWWVADVTLFAGLLAGLAVGLLWRQRWQTAAAAVDAHYRLKDRSATALDFLAKSDAGDLHRLQIDDALHHLNWVRPADVVPYRTPRALPYAAAALIAAGVLPFILPGTPQVNAEPRAPLPNVIAEAEKLVQRLNDLEETLNDEADKDAALKDLIGKLKQKAEELKQDDVDEKEALAKLSEMQTAIQTQLAQFNTAVVDGQLASLGGAMMSAAATAGAGKALQDNKLDKAAQELEQLDDPNIDRKEEKALEEKLKQVAKEMSDVGLGQLSAAVSEMADSLKGGKSKVGKASKVLAKQVANQARRKKVNDLLARQLEDLKDSKCNCNCNGGLAVRKPQKSTSPSSNWGRSISGNVDGEKTKLLGQRNQVQLTGTPGEGPSDVETTSSPEARQQAARAYKEMYQKYQKLSEAVLEGEAIPLGQRQMIRKYFELIRPQNGDLADKPAEKDKK